MWKISKRPNLAIDMSSSSVRPQSSSDHAAVSSNPTWFLLEIHCPAPKLATFSSSQRSASGTLNCWPHFLFEWEIEAVNQAALFSIQTVPLYQLLCLCTWAPSIYKDKVRASLSVHPSSVLDSVPAHLLKHLVGEISLSPSPALSTFLFTGLLPAPISKLLVITPIFIKDKNWPLSPITIITSCSSQTPWKIHIPSPLFLTSYHLYLFSFYNF